MERQEQRVAVGRGEQSPTTAKVEPESLVASRSPAWEAHFAVSGLKWLEQVL